MLYDNIKQDIAQAIDRFVINPRMEKVGERIKTRRELLEITQEQLSARVGISQPTLANLEGGNNARSKYLFEIARELGVSVEWLATGDMTKFSMTYLAPDETELIRLYRESNQAGKEFIQRSSVLAEKDAPSSARRRFLVVRSGLGRRTDRRMRHRERSVCAVGNPFIRTNLWPARSGSCAGPFLHPYRIFP